MVSDRLGRDLKVGDSICVRGKLIEIDEHAFRVAMETDVPGRSGKVVLFLEPRQVRFVEAEDE